MTAKSKRTARRRQALAVLGGFVIVASATFSMVTNVGAGADEGATEVAESEETTTTSAEVAPADETATEETTPAEETVTEETTSEETDPPTDDQQFETSVSSLDTGEGVAALASATYEDFALHNTTAQVGTDCPDPDNDYWHFIIAPNNGKFHFLEIQLNLGSGYSPYSFINNGSQDDNVFVLVPGGSELTDLVAGHADILSDTGAAPMQFNLSHICVGGDETLGSLEITKVMVGTPDENEGYPFTVTVDCTDGTTSLAGFPKQHDFEAPEPHGSNPWFIGGIPAGAECTTAEPDPKNATLLIDPVGAVTIVVDETSEVTVTNTYEGKDTGGLTVSKTVVGPVPAGTEFTVTVTCDKLDPFVLVFDDGGNLISGSVPITGLAADIVCHVEETDADGTNPTITYSLNVGSETPAPPDVTINTSTQSVEVTNTYIDVGGEFTGSVNVEKRGVGQPPADGTEFLVNIRCIGPTVDVDQDVGLVYSSKLTESISFSAPSVETVGCTVTERDPLGGALNASISPNGGVVTLTVDVPATDVVVTNDYGDPQVTVGIEVAGTSVTGALALTGSESGTLLKSAAALLGIGVAALLVTRRRRRATLLG